LPEVYAVCANEEYDRSNTDKNVIQPVFMLLTTTLLK